MNKALKRIAVISAILILIGILMAFVEIFSFSMDFYAGEFEKLGTAEDIGISHDDAVRAMQVLLDYLKGKRDDIDLTVRRDGMEISFYNEKEYLHMIDVRALYRTAKLVGFIGAGAGLSFMILSLIFAKDARKDILDGYILGNFIFFGILLALGLFAAIDFDTFWVSFHRVFFSNDLWLMDPYTDNMILLCEEEMFFDLVIRIAACSLIVIGAMLVTAVIWRKKESDRQREQTEG